MSPSPLKPVKRKSTLHTVNGSKIVKHEVVRPPVVSKATVIPTPRNDRRVRQPLSPEEPPPSAAKTTRTKRLHKNDESDDDAAGALIPEGDKIDLGIDMTIKAPEHVTINHPEHIGWTQSEVDLFNRLNDRGAVPILPHSWQLDFPTMPDNLFSSNLDEVYIKPSEGTDFRAIKAFSSLLACGTRIRDRNRTGRDPTPILSRAIAAYKKWALTDAGLAARAYVPNLVVAAQAGREAVQDTVDRMTRDLRLLAARHRAEALRCGGEPAPTLYGVIVVKSVMAFVTYDARQVEGAARNLADFHWRDEGQDVWNAFAVAILCVQAREYLVERGGDIVEGTPDAEDPDE